MVDINFISVGLQSAKTALEIAKELKNIDSLFKDAEAKLKLADLIEALSEVKVNLSEAKVENQELKSKISELEAKLKLKQEVEFRNGHYYSVNPEQGKPSGPFCALCYSDSNKLIVLNELSPDMQTFGKYLCPKCNSNSN